ncbi:MAG: hypothetical protein AMXMBFR16_10100 [Candidatus Uhrbacteria bacterium]
MFAETRQSKMVPRTFIQITNLANAVAITNCPTDISATLLTAENQAVRWRDDRIDPTNAVGQILAVNTPFWYYGDPSKLKFIEGAASAKLNITLYNK